MRTVMRCSKSMNDCGAPVSLRANESARASTRRESWLEIVPTAVETTASASATAGSAAGVPR